MSGFLGELVSEFTGSGGERQNQGYSGGQEGGPDNLPPPWTARWDNYRNCWIYINQQTGEETPQRPGTYGGGYSGGYEEPRHEGGGHGLAYGAMGAAAGLAGGALLMHEGEDIKDDYERDKYRVEEGVDDAGNYVERKFDNGVNDVENFPDNAARWTGEKVGEVEDIPQDIEQDYDRAKYGVENRFDNAVQDVEDIPQDIGEGFDDVAGFMGRKVGDVERFGDGIDNSFDQGEAQGRDDY